MVFQGSKLVFSWFLWSFKVSGWFSRFQFVFLWFQGLVFQGSRLVFHGSRWVLMVFHGFRLVFIVPGRFSMVLGGFFMAPGGFSWFFKVLGCFL